MTAPASPPPRHPLILRLGHPGRRAMVEVFVDGRLEIHSRHGVRGADRAIIESISISTPPPNLGKSLVVGSREGVVGLALALLAPDSTVHHFATDSYESARVRQTARANGVSGVRGVRHVLAANLPRGAYDWIWLPTSQHGDAILNADLIRSAFAALKDGGKLVAGTDNARDNWLRARVADVFGALTIHHETKSGRVYIARKQPGKKPRQRDLRRVYKATLFGAEVDITTWPGVFSHGRLDDGALALAEVAKLTDARRILDLGCGSGVLGVAAARAAPERQVILVDSNARATTVAVANARQNGVHDRCCVLLAHHLDALSDAVADAVLANPPYFGGFRIARQFARDAARVLRTDGRLYMVGKTESELVEICRQEFGAAEVTRRRGYVVVSAEKAAG